MNCAQENRRPAGLVVWFTGLTSAGKTTIAEEVRRRLSDRGSKVELLDGDVIRQTLSHDLTFTPQDRAENVRRLAFMASLLERQGLIVLVAAVSPFRKDREDARKHCGKFLEVYVNAPLTVCENRDLKGIYRRARIGEIAHVAGLDDPYELPLEPDVECHTDCESVAESVEKVLHAIALSFPQI